MNCIDVDAIQWVSTTYALTGCNLKTKELLDCELIGIYVVTGSNTVYIIDKIIKHKRAMMALYRLPESCYT